MFRTRPPSRYEPAQNSLKQRNKTKTFSVIYANPVTTAGALTLFTQNAPAEKPPKACITSSISRLRDQPSRGRRKRFSTLGFDAQKALCSDFRTNTLTQQQ